MKQESNPDPEALRMEIADFHKALIDAHLKKDVDFFVQNLSEDYMSVSGGEISQPTVEEIRSRFNSYLNNTTFTEYRDLREPIISLSKDGSIAWSIVQVKVAGRRKLEEGGEVELDFICAWITLFERRGDRRLRLGEVSSFKEAD
jgi:hypothetical protein